MARTITTPDRDFRWVAGRDGIAHANRGHDRTLCNRLPLPLRFAWPEKSKCPACEEVATAKTARPA